MVILVLEGTIINALAIIAGGIIGSFLSNIPDKIRVTIMQGLGLAVIVQGISMALKSDNFLLLIFSLALGSVIGEVYKLDDRLNSVGTWIERKVGKKKKGNVAAAFVTATLVYTIGAMAILGALNSGLNNDHNLLYLKSMLDGFSAIIFASSLGIGVIFSAIPVFIYQGAITIFAKYINLLLSKEILDAMITELTAVGGLLIIAIAINILDLKKISTANMLPAVVIAPLGVLVLEWLAKII